MELREIFDKVKAHLVQQNKKSMDSNSPGNAVCAYRGINGASCAVGCLIPDSLYTEQIEGITIRSILNTTCLIEDQKKLKEVLIESVGELTHAKMDLLKDLQDLHDYCTPDAWAHRFDFIESNYFSK